ncbi:MAG TPA: GNAT family N-acetyltransferase [Mucilaginibacter sp.]|nr:GNAT family N-acetyltransferase [Mucilaginibacter sp.]
MGFPVSFTIRKANAADVPALAALHVHTFNETHGPGPAYNMREYQWREIFKEDVRDQFCLVMEITDGQLIGFARGIPYDHRGIPAFSGELNKIYLLREYQKQGLGRRLIGRVAQEFLSRGINSMLLFGDENNPSNHAYESWGAEKLYAANGEFHGGYGWRDLEELTRV